MTRAKPLNALTRAALAVAVDALGGEIEYLADALQGNVAGHETLEQRFKEKHAALVRAREWIKAKLDSVEEGEDD